MPRIKTLSALLLIVAVGVVAAGTVVVGAADGQDAATDDPSRIETAVNTSNALALDGEPRETYIRADVDVAGATAVSAERLRGSYASLTFVEKYEREEGSSARIASVRDSIDRVDRKLTRLGREQEQLYRAYANGSLTPRTFVRRLVHIRTAAAQTRAGLEDLQTTVENDLSTSLPLALDRRMSRLTADPVTLPAPVSTDLRAAVTSESDPILVYTRGSESGLILTTTTGQQYKREATLRSAYAPDQPNRYEGAITEAYQRALDLYPWVAENAINGPNLRESGGNVYRVNANHPHGELTTYIHGGSGDVFHEIQRKQPYSVPITGTVSNETAELSLTVDRTTATGPMRISVARPDSGPTQAEISINGQSVGTTSTDGTLWVVQPAGQVRVNATVAGDHVVVGWR
jgi:hypothetical protein